MRITVANWNRRRIGGAEEYLNLVVPALCRAGHETSFFCQADVPADRAPITMPANCVSWCVAESGLEPALAALRAWRPDVIYTNKIATPSLEEELQTVAPAVLFAHDYHGTCISGLKAFKFPVVTPCDRRFGWQCLALYFPRRCGGTNPLTMIELYRTQSRRLGVLRNYSAIVTASEHMRAEFLKHGCAPASVRQIVHPIDSEPTDSGPIESAIDNDASASATSDSVPARLLFMGRMDRLKGGSVLIDALPEVASRLGRAVHLVLAGAGPARRRWEIRAALIAKRDPRVSVEFAGWLDQAGLNRLSVQSDLLVMPSLWPEPFGRAGLEAGLHRLPVAGFAVGAIPEWLSDGVNGYLAPGHPPTADGLAGAIVKCLRDPTEYARLRHGAREVARRFTLDRHLDALVALFAEVARGQSRRFGT